MSEKRYQVTVGGQLTGKASLAQAKENIAKLFNSAPQQVEPLFSGKRIVIKQGISQEAAQQYMNAVNNAGLQCFIEEMVAPASTPSAANPPQQATAAHNTGGLDAAGIAPPGTIIIEQTPVSPPAIDTTAYSMGQPGEILVEAQPQAAPNIDTSALNLAPLGSDMGQIKKTPPPPPDPGDLKLE